MCDGERPSFLDLKIILARKDHECCECHTPILPGTKYERVNGVWGGEWTTFKTCMSCSDIRHELRDGHCWAPFGCLSEWAHEAGININD